MQNSWQSKCGSMWQPSSMPPPPPLEASSSHVFQNQEEHFLAARHSSCLQLQQKSMPLAREIVQEPMFANTSLYNPRHAELGTPYLSLLSGTSSLLPCDLQPLSHPKLVFNCSQGPMNRSGTDSTMESRVSLLPGWLCSQSMDNQNVKSRADSCSVISSSAMVNLNHGNTPGLKFLETAESNLPKSELARMVAYQIPQETDPVKDFPSLMGFNNLGSTSVNGLKLQNGANIVASQRVSREIDFSRCSQTPNVPSGCPRVLCSGTSGDLLISNTGVLGVVCSCHGFYMSISKFSEHSGMYNANPGNAVRLENGDTIAHWRKTYFLKVGIRIPEDHKGWDWPEGFSAAPGLTNRIISNMSNNTGVFNQVCRLRTSGGSGQPVTYLKDQYSGKAKVDEFQNNGKQGYSEECSRSLFKGFIGASQRNLQPAAYSHITCTSNSVGTRGLDEACKPTTANLDSILKNASPFTALPNFQNLKCPGKGSREGEGLAMCSNIELRLGQLSKHSQAIGSLAPLAVGLHRMATQSENRNPFSSDQLLEKSLLNGNYRGSEVVNQTHQIAAITSNTIERRESAQLNHVRGAYSALVDKTDSYDGVVQRGPVIDPLPSCFKNPEAEVQFKNVNNIANGSHVFTEKPHYGYHVPKYDQHCVPWCRVAGNIMESHSAMLNAQKQVSKCKGVESIDDIGAAAELNFGLHKPCKESQRNFNVVPVQSDHTIPAFHEKVPAVCQRAYVFSNDSITKDTSNNSLKISPLSHTGHSALCCPRSIIDPMDSQATISPGFSSTSSVCVQSTAPALSKKFTGVSLGLLNENMKMHTVQYMMESSNRHATGSVKNLQEPEMLNKPFAKPQVNITSTIANHIQVLNSPSLSNMAEPELNSTLSAGTSWRGLNNEKSAPPTVLSEGTSFHAEAGGVPFQRSFDLHPIKQLFVRFEGDKRKIASSEQEVAYQGLAYAHVPEKCSCAAVHAHCLTGKYDLKDGMLCDSLNKQEGIANGRSGSLFRSVLNENSVFSKEKTKSSHDNENVMAQNIGTVESHSSQWRDVPSKVMETCSSTRKHQQAVSFNSNGNFEDSAAKSFARSSQNAEPSKEHEKSNVSSGYSAPLVTLSSIELNKRDSSTVDTGDIRCRNNIVVDESSRIDKSCSSDETRDSERSADFFDSAPRMRSSVSLIEEFRLRDSLRPIKAQNEILASFSSQEEGDPLQNIKKGPKRMKKTVKWKKLDAAFPVSGQSSNNGSSKSNENVLPNSNLVWDMQMPLGREQKGPNNCVCSVEPSVKRRRYGWPSSDSTKNRDLHTGYQVEQTIEEHVRSRIDGETTETPETLRKKRLKLDGATATSKNQYRPCCDNAEITDNFTLVGCSCNSLDRPLDFYKWMARPVVSGKYGIISNGNSLKPAKIVPLHKILETARKCDGKNGKVKSTTVKKKKMSSRHVKESSRNKDLLKIEYYDAPNVEKSGAQNVVSVEFEPHHSFGEMQAASYHAINGSDEVLHISAKRGNDNCGMSNPIITKSIPIVQLKTKRKEVRKRSLNELIVKGNDSAAYAPKLKNQESLSKTSSRHVGKLMRNSADDKLLAREMHNSKRCGKKRLYESIRNLDEFCCVCGRSNKNNHLLECNKCLIKVHQACYGISNIPKSQWYCRPCKIDSKNIVCVLCGYGGGAMTQALKSQNAVKSLLQAWNAMSNSKINCSISTDNAGCQSSKLASGRDSLPVMRRTNMESSSITASNMNTRSHVDIVDNSSSPCNSMPQNSITDGVVDSSVKQWVHVVCGLWTPGTHCPHLDTMNAFDVSGAISPKENMVCSICSRLGGFCIKCQILDCSVHFHAWCAHQKGLLQTEAKGNDSENVDFYGRCMLHATTQQFTLGSYPIDTETLPLGQNRLTCARTEGYNRQKNKQFWHNLSQESDGGSGSCHVPQEQLNAWLHMNKQKPHGKGLPKLPSSSVESDYRKEYARYKHSKGWKHLVVYKSDIHALGLYTSQFISRGAMVVEYVGEIVGLRVSDKREREYHSGKKVQYKSACYFFRIDKERIIDATRKGGIARFVNHSCQPNCVAKIISVRNEKKVVFFAERDVYPGEEITYDYHFNHEDEGEKIPCYCNAKNCRRYLN